MSKWHLTIQPKSDQLNADDLIGRELTITIRDVQVLESNEQPAHIFYDGDNGKPYKPCKTMRKLIAHCWGTDERNYIGRSVVLFRDESVRWAGEEVGGIRIKAMSHINERKRVMLQANKKSKVAVTVDVLKMQQPNDATAKAQAAAATIKHSLTAAATPEEKQVVLEANAKIIDRLKVVLPDAHAEIVALTGGGFEVDESPL